jgi:hypothetical protein
MSEHTPSPAAMRAATAIVKYEVNLINDDATRHRIAILIYETSGLPDLLNALRLCEATITELVEAERPTVTDWLNVRTARDRARLEIAKAEGQP